MDTLREYFETIKNLLDLVDTQINLPIELNCTLRDMFSRELIMFFLYLSATDGKVSFEEERIINELFENNFSANEYANLIKECNIYSSDFENSIPISIRYSIEFDKMEFSNISVTEMIIDFFESSGTALISCDGITRNEQYELDNYICKLRNFATQNSTQMLIKTTSNTIHNNSLKDNYLKKKK